MEMVGLRLIKKTDYLDEKGGTHYYYLATMSFPWLSLTFFVPGYSPGRLGTSVVPSFLSRWKRRCACSRTRAPEAQWCQGLRCSRCAIQQALLFHRSDGHICAISTPTQLTIDEPTGELGRKLCYLLRSRNSASRSNQPRSTSAPNSDPALDGPRALDSMCIYDRACPLACRSSVIKDATKSSRPIEIERRNAESNNPKEDKDERDGTRKKPDPV